MYSKVLKVVWIISMLAVLATLFYTYAGLSENMTLGLLEASLNKDWFFYFSLLLLAVFNATAFVLPRFLALERLIGWYYGLLSTLHLFLLSVFIFVYIINSQEKYDYTRLGPMVYGAFLLFMAWLLAFFFIRKDRQPVG